MRSRMIMIIVALILGGVGAVMAGSYLNGAKARIDADSEPVEVLVAEGDIPKGVSSEQLFEQKLVTRTKIPRRFVSSGAISSARMVEGQVLAVSLSAGEQLTTGRFQYPSEAGLAHNVPRDYLAVSIPVDAVSGVSGLLKPGDNVAVIMSFAGEEDEEAVTRIVVRKTKILALDRSVGVERNDAATTKVSQSNQGMGAGVNTQGQTAYPITVTVAVSPAEAEKLVFGANFGSATKDDRKIWLALLPADSDGAPVTTGISNQTVFK